MNNNISVLFIDDLQQNVDALVSEFIKQGFSIEYNRVNTCSDMLDMLNKNTYDLIFSDYNLAESSTAQVLKLLTERNFETPVIVILDTYNEMDMLTAIKAGCSDYLLRGDASRLRAVVLRIICEKERENQYNKVSKHTNTKEYCFDTAKVRYIQKQLREERRNLSAVFEATPVGLAILDENLIVRRINPELANRLGKSAKDMISRRLGNSFNCVNSTQHKKGCGYGDSCKFCSHAKYICEVNETGEAVYGKELPYSLIIGGKVEKIWLRVNAVPTLLHGRKHVILVVDEITENKKAEEALIKSRDFYLKLFEEFPALIWRSGLDAKCNYFNKSWLEFSGRTFEEELGDGWVAGVHPDDTEKCFNIYINAFNKRQSFDMEYRLRRHDGKYRWISDSGRPLFDTEGVFCGYIGSCYDITEKKNELELLGKYQLLSRYANDIIFFLDERGNVLETNEAALEKYGYTREEFKALNILDLRKADSGSLIKEHLEEVWNKRLIFDTKHFRKDGSSFYVEASWNAAEIGNERRVLCVIRDINERKQLQTYLEEKNSELHNALESLKQTQNQLVQQEQFAAIGTLAAGVAHEINNPLGFVISNLNTLEKYCNNVKEVMNAYDEFKEAFGKADYKKTEKVLAEIEKLEVRYHINSIKEDVSELLTETEDGLYRISKIVAGLRAFSRVDDMDENIDFNLNDCVENSLLIANNEIKYYADIEKHLGDIPSVALQGNQVNQVLLNIIINAVHAIKEKQEGERGLVKISTYGDERYIYCKIEDNGTGISEENLNKIFTPFFTTKPVGKGTGLGLSISYDLVVNKYGGEIFANSTLGKGTVFTVKLPIN